MNNKEVCKMQMDRQDINFIHAKRSGYFSLETEENDI